jgi:ferric-dicitrate binding protein FerR (iron transport regulator)
MTSHDPINQTARDLFERASARVDQPSAQRLRRARQDALQSRPRSRLAAGLMPAGAFAAAVLALGLAWWMPPRPAATPAADPTVATTDAEIEGLMTEEDPELYSWLADAPVATGRGGRQ